MLQAHPDCLAALQAGLDAVAARAPDAIDPFERANWVLEGTLERYISDTRALLEAAESNADPSAIAQARDMLQLLDRARSPNIGLADLDELYEWFKRDGDRDHD